MTDDPTVTRPEETPADEVDRLFIEQVEKLHAALGGDPAKVEPALMRGRQVELPPFRCNLEVTASEGSLIFSIIVRPPDGPAGKDRSPGHHAFRVPRALLGDADPERLYKIIAHNFTAGVWPRLADEAMLFFTDLVNFAMMSLNPGLSEDASRNHIIKNHAERTGELLRKFFKVKPHTRGRPSPWTLVELSEAVQKAAAEVAEQVPGRLTAAKVAKRMKRHYPEKAPPSGKALLALIKRHGLKWEELLPPERQH